MPKRKDQALSPVMSPSSPDGSRRGWDWMKGKFQRRISGRFKNVANEDSQDLTSFDSPDTAQPSSQISSSTTVIEKTHPTNDPIRRDSQLESVAQTHDVVEDDRGEQLDNASLEDKTYNTLEMEPEVILESEKLLPEVSVATEDSHISSSPEIDLNKAEGHDAQSNGLSAVSSSTPMSIYEQQMVKIHSLEVNDSEICKRILSVVALARQPPSLNELAVLADLPSTSESDKLIGECSYCLTFQSDGTVCFEQQAVKEYLLDDVPSEIFPEGLKAQHHAVFSRLLQAIAVGLKRDIYDLREPGCLIDDVKIPTPDPLEPLRYACLHLVEHLILSECEEQDLKQDGVIGMFLQRDYLHWVEALSLLKKLSNGVFWMFNLEKFVTARGASSSLISRTRDAYRFIQHHKATIEESPLQAYSSALVFSPAQSITRNQFKHEEPSWIETKPILEDDWNSCLMTLDGHQGSVLSLSWISNDTIASTSQDGTAKVWDISTSRCLSTLESDGIPISSLGRLRNAELGLILGDGRIWTWRATEDNSLPHSEDILSSRGEILSFKDTVESFVTASWSSKGTLAFVGEDGSIWIRHFMHMARDHPLFPLKGNHRGVAMLAWSHDGRLASGASDGTIKIWDAVDGECKLSPSGHSEGIHALAWSQDGQRLASASKDSIIKIWNTKNGRCMAWVQGQSQLIRSLSWSPDGRLAGADGDTVRIWDSATGKCLSRLEGHTHQIWSVTWSEDGSRLASASRDKTIKIWDTTADEKKTHPLGHSQRVKSIAWSADKKQLASVSDDDTVAIWNTYLGGDVHILTENVSDVRSLTWSKNGEKLALIAGNNTVVIWNTITGEWEKTLMTEGDDIKSIVWSEDGTKLASTSGNRKTDTWDISSEKRIGDTSEHGSSESRIEWSGEIFESETSNFDSNGTWITSQGKRQLKLPPGYNIECLTIVPERIGIGCGSGRVLTFAVSENGSL